MKTNFVIVALVFLCALPLAIAAQLSNVVRFKNARIEIEAIDYEDNVSYYERPSEGNKILAMRFVVRRAPEEAPPAIPASSFQLRTPEGKRFVANMIEKTISRNARANDAVDVAPNETLLGWFIFEVPQALAINECSFRIAQRSGEATDWAALNGASMKGRRR